jgi:hypothetical protein
VVQGGIPGARANAEVTFRGKLAGYLDADVKTGGRDYRFLFDDTPDCRTIVTGGGEISYGTTGILGVLRRGDTSCEPAGVLNLPVWNRVRGRVEGEGIARAQATYTIFVRADDVALARGRFPLVSRVGFSGGWDIVVVIPDNGECSGVLNSQVASMEFRPSGSRPLSLMAGGTRCALLGIIPALDKTTGKGEG